MSGELGRSNSERKTKALENRALTRTSEPTWEEAAENWRKKSKFKFSL